MQRKSDARDLFNTPSGAYVVYATKLFIEPVEQLRSQCFGILASPHCKRVPELFDDRPNASINGCRTIWKAVRGPRTWAATDHPVGQGVPFTRFRQQLI